MTHVYVWANRIFIVSYNGSVSPVQHQAITRTSTCINLLSIEPSGTNFSEIYSLQTYSWKTILFNISSAKCRPFCSGLCMIILDQSLYHGFSYFHVTNFASSWVLIFHFIFTQINNCLLISLQIQSETLMKENIKLSHDFVIKWKNFPRYWPFVRGIHRSPVNSPHKGQWRWALVFSLICALNKRLSKQSWGWRFETPRCSLWRHCNASSSKMLNKGVHQGSLLLVQLC